MALAVENTSGQGKVAVIPEEVRGWSWGAFGLSWIWGVSNGVWISLLVFVPYLGFIWPIVLGVKGNQWAWQHKRWDGIEHFRSTQGKWSIAGVIVFVVTIILVVVAILLP